MLSFAQFGANEWRIEWSLRTCISVAVSAALALYLPTQHSLNNNGLFDVGPPFGCFVCIIVKDNTLGGSTANAWGCLYGAFIACFTGFIVQSLIGTLYNAAAAILLLFLFTFLLNYIEFHPMGKKLGLSILALNLLTVNPDPYSNWLLFMNVLVGILTGLIGNILPWPRLACDEVEKRGLFCAEAIGSLLKDIVSAWRYAAVPIINTGIPSRKSNSLLSHLLDDDKASGAGPVLRPRVDPQHQHRAWRLLRNFLLAAQTFRHKSTGMRWSTRYSHHKNNVHMRLELARFLDEVMVYMTVLVADARFGPSRARAIVRYDHFMGLMKDILLVVSTLEKRLRDIRLAPQAHPVLFAYHDHPDFRAAVDHFISCVAESLSHAAIWITEPRLHPSDEAVVSLHHLRLARDRLDQAYILVRVDMYYNDDPAKCFPMSSTVAMNHNSFMFLFDTCCFLLENHWKVYVNDNFEESIPARPDWLASLLTMGASIRADLFPRQRHLFDFTGGAISPVMFRRFKQSASLSVSMAIAGVYGLYADRQQAFLASFTIAYLTGGLVSGANAITSLNRAVGTVAGSVYAVIIAYIVAGAGWGIISTNVFIFFAVVLFQLPCTYVRTLPLYGYAGTVAAFTAAVLLLVPSLNQEQAVDRIIDTYVGVVIFLIVDFSVAPNYSDDALLADIYKVFKNIKGHFTEFIEVFKSQSADKAHRSSLLTDIAHGKDVTLFSSTIPVPWRPPPLEKRIVDELIAGSEAAHRAIQGMMWALVACRREDRSDFAYLLRPLSHQLNKVSAFVDNVSGYLQSNADHMREWSTLKSTWSHCSTSSLINGDYGKDRAETAFSNKLALVSSGDEEAEEVREFFSHIDDIMQNLQDAYRDSSNSFRNLEIEIEEGEDRMAQVLRRIISNEEVKSVNSVLACTKDLVEALRAISASMTRLRAYRDIRLTQSGTKKSM